MLVVSRKTSPTPGARQKIMAGEVTFTVLEIRGNQVRIGVDAPSTTPIHRGEIHHELPPMPEVRE